MIGVDWGTTNCRAFLFENGEIVDRAEGPGLLNVPGGDFGVALRVVAGHWLARGSRRVLLAGMVGSRQGWLEAPYLPCPADPSTLARFARRVPFDDADVRLLPGLSAEGAAPEVMRGEEVQIAGVLDRTGPGATICLPGSHSKWVRVEAGRVSGFRTAMTGEVFAALRHHTILARTTPDAPHHPEAFARGLARAAEPGGLLHHVFGVRTLGLFGRLADTEAASYLSGLVIGHEVREAGPIGTVFLVGAAELCRLYATAVEAAGGSAPIIEVDAAAAGLMRIGEHVAWD